MVGRARRRAVGRAEGKAAVEIVDTATAETVDKVTAEVVGTVTAEVVGAATAEVGTEIAGRMAVEPVVGRMDRPLVDEASYLDTANVLRGSAEEVGCTVVVRLRRTPELHWDSSAEDIRNPTFRTI